MADVDNGSIQVLITPLGGALPKGESADAIRNQLQTALAGKNGITVNVMPAINVTEFTQAIQAQLKAGIKINVTPNIVGGTSSSKTVTKVPGISGGLSKSDLKLLDKQLAQLEVKMTSFSQRLASISDISLRSDALIEYQSAINKIIAQIYKLKNGETELSEHTKAGLRDSIAEVAKLVKNYEQLGASQANLSDKLDVYRMKAEAALGGLSTFTGPVNESNSRQALTSYQELVDLLDGYREKGAQLTGSEMQGINELIAKIGQLRAASEQYYKQKETSSKKAEADAAKETATLASMKMEYAQFQQYVKTLDPTALTKYSSEINRINTLLSSGSVKSYGEATAAVKAFKAEMISAGYRGGNSKSGLSSLETQLSNLEVKSESLKQRLRSISNVPLQTKGLRDYQAQYDKIEQEIYEIADGSDTLSTKERLNIQERIKELSKLVTRYEQLAATQEKLSQDIEVYRMKAYNATGGILSDSGNVNYSAMSQQYAELGRLLYEYQARGTQLSKTEVQGINERIAALRQLHTASNQYYKTQEANSKKADADNKRNAATLADMQLELSKFNQYLASVNPKALTQFSGQISNIRDLLNSGIPADGKIAANAMKTLKASIKEAGYEGGTAFSVLANKMKEYGKYLISSAVVMGATKALSQLISNVKTLDGALTDLRIVTGGTREETEELLDSYSELAQKLGTTTTSVAEGAADWLRQGYTGDQAETLLTQSMTLSIVGDMDSTSATEALTSAIKGNCKYSLCVQKCA